MSGGYFDYNNDSLCHDIFGWQLSPTYGESGREQSTEARAINPMEDGEISEMLWDMFCLVHSFDWYKEGDTDEEQYREDVKAFKEKWIGVAEEDRLNRNIKVELEEAERRLRVIYGGKSED